LPKEEVPIFTSLVITAQVYRCVQLNRRVWRHQHPRTESSPRSPGEVNGGLGRVEEGSQGGFVTVDVDECSDVIK
jgi:hypothetical protein